MEAHEQITGSYETSPSEEKGSVQTRPVRALRFLFCLFAAFGATQAFAQDDAAGPVEEEAATHPPFLFEPLYASNQGSVYGIYEASHADLVLLEGGFDSGFRTGMICEVAEGETEVAEVMLVDVRKNCAAALILQLESGQVIEPDHSVTIKTVKF